MNRQFLLLVLTLGFVLRIGACLMVPLDKKPWGDMAQYINLGISLAEGKGYVLEEGNCWPGKPTIIRTPGWPLILSIPYRMVPEEWYWPVARALSVGFDVVNIVLIVSLATAVGGRAEGEGGRAKGEGRRAEESKGEGGRAKGEERRERDVGTADGRGWTRMREGGRDEVGNLSQNKRKRFWSRFLPEDSLGRSAIIAGGLYAVNPVTIALSAQVGCEPAGLTFLLLFLRVAVSPICSRAGYGVDLSSHAHRVTAAATGFPFVVASMRAWISSVWWRYALAGLLLGMACLVRTNWLVIAGFTGLGILWIYRRSFGCAILLAAVFGCAVLVPMTPWLIRNAVVFDRFPVFGAGGGETFFGGNNDLAADPRSPMWGYIVQPGGIPGEPGVPELATRMNEVEVDRYWMGQGVKWLKKNPRKIPMLVAGKLRRAFVPMPRNSKDPLVLAASLYRACLYVAGIAGVVWLIRRKIAIQSDVWMIFGAVVLATVVTTVVFCGVMRYVIGFEVLLCLPAGWWVGGGRKCELEFET